LQFLLGAEIDLEVLNHVTFLSLDDLSGHSLRVLLLTLSCLHGFEGVLVALADGHLLFGADLLGLLPRDVATNVNLGLVCLNKVFIPGLRVEDLSIG